jgi:uncharacterized protein YndB with AHSA1/START domain
MTAEFLTGHPACPALHLAEADVEDRSSAPTLSEAAKPEATGPRRERVMTGEQETHDVVVTRRFDAPQERVWQAWSDADEVMKWWGPHGFTSPTCRMDFREGGTTLVSMRSDQGWDMFNTWTYRSIEPMVRIEFVHGFADEDGNRVSPAQLGLSSAIPDEVRHEVTLTAIDGSGTELTVHEFGYPSLEIAEVSRRGMEECLEKMAASLAAR